MSFEMLNTLVELASTVAKDDRVSVVVLESVHDDFCYGIDLKDPAVGASVMSDFGRTMGHLGSQLIHLWSSLPMPTVCRFSGQAVGAGACLVWASDFRIAPAKASIWFPEIDRGMHLGWGIIRRLVSELGPQWARRLALLAERVHVDAFPDGHFIIVDAHDIETPRTLLDNLSSKPVTATRGIKACLEAAARGEMSEDMDISCFIQSVRDPEFMERVNRWLMGDT